jgi:hypothetical protein
MGEEVTQSDEMLKSSAGPDGIDEVDKVKAKVECDVIEKCEGNNKGCDGSVSRPQAEKSPKRPSMKPQENSFEKSKKWYNISFMHRAGSSSNSRSTNTADNKNSTKMDKRHSWHLNDSVEM